MIYYGEFRKLEYTHLHRCGAKARLKRAYVKDLTISSNNTDNVAPLFGSTNTKVI